MGFLIEIFMFSSRYSQMFTNFQTQFFPVFIPKGSKNYILHNLNFITFIYLNIYGTFEISPKINF